MDGLLMVCNSILPLLVVVCALLYGFSKKRTDPWSKKLPQGSLGLPYLGETLQFVYHAYTSRPERFMDKRRARYGKVFKSHLFGGPTIVSTDPEVSKMVLHGDAFVPSYPRSLTELMGESSILLINGSLHRRIHGLIGAFFKSSYLKAQFTEDVQKYLKGSMGSWEDGNVVYIQNEAKHIAFQVLVRGLIGLSPGEEMQYLKQQFQAFIAGLMSLPVKIPGTRLYRSLQAKKKMVKFVKDIIRKKRLKTEACSSPRDVIDVLLSDGNDQLTDDLISENMIDLIIPGEDSVPTLMTLVVKYLSETTPALKKIEEENMQLKQKKARTGETLCWADYMSLPFTQNVITETLRLGNIISGIMRRATRDIEVKGHFIPKGWCVFPYFRSVHLEPNIYDDPHSFNPWRWHNKDMGTCSFTPFGGGQRLCPGLDLARLETAIFLHHLVTNFTWVADKDTVVNFPTVRMRGRMPITVTRRK